MLKGVDHRLNAEVLACLQAMGHGDMLIVADTYSPVRPALVACRSPASARSTSPRSHRVGVGRWQEPIPSACRFGHLMSDLPGLAGIGDPPTGWP